MTKDPSNVTAIGGVHAVKALLKGAPQGVQELLILQGRRDSRVRALKEAAVGAGIPVRECDRRVLDDMAVEVGHQGVVALFQGKALGSEKDLMPHLQTVAGPWLVLVLDEIQDPRNLGACLRSADAAGVHAVVVPIDNCPGLTPVVRKTAAGAAETVPIFQVTNVRRTLQLLQDSGVWVHGAAGEATEAVFDVDFSGSVALVMGSEGAGLRRLTKETCDGLFQIPMKGQVSSLNLSVATAVALFEVNRQRR
ncbi:MAG: 23S rRNA (guanosine(2251)-2'-O)-methyltransferase RlmB [Gammaproteobacteria bacterium]|nr:23S rRNA (guanosine(2251)-2'-O)-methyltransferase RlmB [Gammaproteobacteria bacterium]